MFDEYSSINFLNKINDSLTEIKNQVTNQKFSTTVKIISNKSNYFQSLNPFIQLEENKNYQAALIGFSTYNSIQNILLNQNDRFKYSTDSGATWKTITIRPGSYEIVAINREIKRQIGIPLTDDKKLHFEAETTINRISLTLDDKHEVDFNIERSLFSLLGFKKRFIKKEFTMERIFQK